MKPANAVESAVQAFCARLARHASEPVHLHAAVEGRDGLTHLSNVERAIAAHGRLGLAKELVWLSQSARADRATLRLRAFSANGAPIQDVSYDLSVGQQAEIAGES